jgi:hypothetical protein
MAPWLPVVIFGFLVDCERREMEGVSFVPFLDSMLQLDVLLENMLTVSYLSEVVAKGVYSSFGRTRKMHRRPSTSSQILFHPINVRQSHDAHDLFEGL